MEERGVLVRCPQCRQPVVFATDKGVFISSRAVQATRVKGMITRAKCRRCRAWIDISEEQWSGMISR